MSTVIIEGSISPSSFLARGDRQEVQRTPFVDALISGGFVDVIEEIEDVFVPPPADLTNPPTEQLSGELPDPPARNASRDDWAEFLANYPEGEFVTEGKKHGELLAAWDEHQVKVEGDKVK